MANYVFPCDRLVQHQSKFVRHNSICCDDGKNEVLQWIPKPSNNHAIPTSTKSRSETTELVNQFIKTYKRQHHQRGPNQHWNKVPQLNVLTVRYAQRESGEYVIVTDATGYKEKKAGSIYLIVRKVKT